jgi:hypothetical protein
MQHGEQRSYKKWRGETVHETPAGAAEERRSGLAGFRIGGPAGDYDGDTGFGDPCKQPRERRNLARRDRGCSEGGDAHGHAAPTGNSGKRCGALHGFADEAKVIARVVGDCDGNLRTRRFRNSHTTNVAGWWGLSSTLYFKASDRLAVFRARVYAGAAGTSSEV